MNGWCACNAEINKMRNPLYIHIFAANYNWNSGFEVPKAILDNENCDFGTGLLIFYWISRLVTM